MTRQKQARTNDQHPSLAALTQTFEDIIAQVGRHCGAFRDTVSQNRVRDEEGLALFENNAVNHNHLHGVVTQQNQ